MVTIIGTIITPILFHNISSFHFEILPPFYYLIVEDEFKIADVIASRLRNEQYIVDVYGEEGLDNALTNIYDLIILERSGMGFTIMESFMDNVEVDSVLGVGTKVTMSKKIKINSSREKQKDVENANNLVNTGVRGEE